MRELVIDNFAGGGGASTGIEMAGFAVDIAVNHDEIALGIHEANHPGATHLCENVWEVDPVQATKGRPVGLAWFSPDCKHFSKAKGGKPTDKRIRSLAWVVTRWAKAVHPRVIILENVEEFADWGPLTADNKPCPHRKGKTFRAWVSRLRNLGYEVDHKILRACDYGAPTIRKRLFLIARFDGRPIVWPEPTHINPNVKMGRLFKSTLKPWRTAAECIDWSIPCPSIFERKKPLADATLRRIAKGIMRYVVDCPDPFIVPVKQDVSMFSETRESLVSAFLAKHFGDKGQRPGSDLSEPVSTVTAVDHHSLVMLHIQRDFGSSIGGPLDMPIGTITAGGGGKVALVASSLVKLRGTCKDGQPVDEPMPSLTAGGTHVAEVRAFLLKYYGTDQDPKLREPLHTVTTKDRFGLVTVHGVNYQIVDIGMRMLSPRELFRAQGFPDSYVIDQLPDGTKISKSHQIRLCGNSVCPDVASALVGANYSQMASDVAV